MLFLPVKIFGMMVLDSVSEFVLGVSFKVYVLVTVLVLPDDLYALTFHRSMVMLERVSLVGRGKSQRDTQHQQSHQWHKLEDTIICESKRFRIVSGLS